MVVLSMHDEQLYAERTLRAGAKAYVMKQDDPEVLLHAIRQVLAGKVHLSERIKESIVNRIGGIFKEDEAATAVDQLSDRELAWSVGMHMTFVVSGVLLALMDRLTGKAHAVAAVPHRLSHEVEQPHPSKSLSGGQ